MVHIKDLFSALPPFVIAEDFKSLIGKGYIDRIDVIEEITENAKRRLGMF